MRLQTLRANFLHHALHRRIDRSDAAVRWLEIRLEHRVTRSSNRRHHPIRTDGDNAIGSAKGNGLVAQATGRVRAHRLHDVADKRFVLRPTWQKTWTLVTAPDDNIGSSFDVAHFVAIDHRAIAGEVEHFRARIAEGLADREQHGITQAATREDHGFVSFDLGRRAGRSH